MFKKWFSRKKDDDDDEDFDEEDFDEEDFAEGDIDDEAPEGPGPEGSGAPEPDDAASAAAPAGQEDGDGAMGEPEASPDAGASGEGDAADIDVDLDDFGDDDFDDEDDDEEEGEESRLAALWDNTWVRFAILGTMVFLLLVIVGLGAWWFISGSSGEGDVATQSVGENLPSATSGGGLQPSGSSLNALSSSGSEEGQTPVAGQLLPPPVVSAEAVSGEQLGGSVVSGLETSSGLNSIGTGGLNAVSGAGQTSPGGGVVVPMTTASSFSQFPDYPMNDALPKAPVPELLEFRGEELPLPKTSADGRVSWQEYARPSTAPSDARRVALLVSGLGLSRAATLSAIGKLPAAVSLSFSPYAEELEQWMIRSRREGHEVVLELPLESSRFPIEDPGPLALQTHNSDADNQKILETVLSSQQGYIGVEVFMGTKFVTDEEKVRSLLTELNTRGLMIIDGDWNNHSLIPRVAGELAMPIAISNVQLDDVMAKAAIDAKLSELDAVVELRGQGIASTTMTPAVMERVLAWISSLPGKGTELVPVSALIKSRQGP